MISLSCTKGAKIDSIKIAYSNSSYDISIANLVKTIVSAQSKLKVELVGIPEDQIAESLADGRADISLSMWFPNTSIAQYDAFKDSLEFLSDYYNELKTGLAVPTYMGISNIEQLNTYETENERIIAVFDTSSVLTKSIYDCVEKYSLSDYSIKVFQFESELLTYVNEKVQKKEAIVFASYQPNWVFASMKVKMLNDHLEVFGKPERASIYARKGFSRDLKQISSFLKQIKLNTNDINEMMRDNEKNDADPQLIAQQWVRDNVDRINLWINKAIYASKKA